ncbi:hypothetical protein HYX02_00400 [Candidatus Woesearchaeota archaeon]|nr:hypothetical protein [Candidatus Woesearchaeota archaeon]
MAVHEVNGMEKRRNTYRKNKKERFVLNRFSRLNSYFTQILKLCLALALFVMAAILISGAGITAENGALNVSNNLFIDTDTLFVDSTNNKVGIGTASPSQRLEVRHDQDASTRLKVTNQGGGTSSSAIIQVTDDVTANFFNHYGSAYTSSGSAKQAGAELATNGAGGMSITSTNGAAVIRFYTGGNADNNERMRISEAGNVGIGTTAPNQRLMVAGNANITGTVYYGALQANSPVLERTAEPFVARCTVADDGKLVVEYIHFDAGAYARVIEAVNSDSASWWHRSCFEKNEKFKFLDSLNNNSITIEDIGFNWSMKTAFKK